MTSTERTNDCKYFNIATLSHNLLAKRFELNDSNYFNENIVDVTDQKHDICWHVQIKT